MRTWRDKYSKDVIGTLLTLLGRVEREREIVGQGQRVDILFTPDPARMESCAELGVLGRVARDGLGLIEPYSKVPGLIEFSDCLRKQRMLHHELIVAARGRKTSLPRLPPHLWMISEGRPRTLIKNLEMRAMADWPHGFWRMQQAMRVHVVVVSELPESEDTLPLRLIGLSTRLRKAVHDVKKLPKTSWIREVAATTLFAWRGKISRLLGEADDMQPIFPEEEERISSWMERVRAAGARELLQKLLEWRFGELPAALEQQIESGGQADIERWAKRVSSAETLDDVFSD